MKKISVKNIIAFRKKSDKSKKTFLKSLEKIKAVDSEGGGNYWVRSISALNNAFKANDNKFINDKIADISDDYADSKFKKTKEMYQRNLDILHNYQDFDFSTWYPNKSFQILKYLLFLKMILYMLVRYGLLPSLMGTAMQN